MSDVDITHLIVTISLHYKLNEIKDILKILKSLGYVIFSSTSKKEALDIMSQIFTKNKLLMYRSMVTPAVYTLDLQNTVDLPNTVNLSNISADGNMKLKQNLIYTIEECNRFHNDPSKNPKSNYTIKPTGATYQQLVKDCGVKPHIDLEVAKKHDRQLVIKPKKTVYTPSECKVFLTNPSKNPRSGYTIKSTGGTYKQLVSDCGQPDTNLLAGKASEKTSGKTNVKTSGKTNGKASGKIIKPPIASSSKIPITSTIAARAIASTIQHWGDVDTVPIGLTFDISNLICSRFSGSYQEFISHITSCTQISNKISESMIRVASTRIFANPAQSIMELPVNSIDSYRRIRKMDAPSIGKFGMGFFSFFYWLTSPLDSLYIYSKYINNNDNTVEYILRVTTVSGVLRGEFLPIDLHHTFQRKLLTTSLIKSHGTAILLSSPDGNLPRSEFKKQISRLRFINDVTYNVVEDILLLPQHATADIEISISKTEVMIVDGAEGISLSVLFNSLLIPSISTKTLVASVSVGGTVQPSRAFVSNRKNRGLVITVGDIIIVHINDLKNIKNNDDVLYVVSLPLNTSLPVSRDDILVDNDSVTYHILQQIFLQLAGDCINSGYNLNLYFEHLRAYALYSGQSTIYQLIDYTYQSIINNNNIIFLPDQQIVNILTPHVGGQYKLAYIEGVFSYDMLPLVIDKYLSDINFEGHTYFKDTVIVPMDNIDNTIDEYQYIFINKKIIEQLNWQQHLISSYEHRILRPYDGQTSLIHPGYWTYLSQFPSFDGLYRLGCGKINIAFLKTELLDELNSLYAVIEAKLESYSSVIDISVDILNYNIIWNSNNNYENNKEFMTIWISKLGNIYKLLSICIMCISYFKLFADNIEQVKEYIHHLRIFMSTFNLATTYGRLSELNIRNVSLLTLPTDVQYDNHRTLESMMDRLIERQMNSSFRKHVRQSCILSLSINIDESKKLTVYSDMSGGLISQINLLSRTMFLTNVLWKALAADDSYITLIEQAIAHMNSGFEMNNVLTILNTYIENNVESDDDISSTTSATSSTRTIARSPTRSPARTIARSPTRLITRSPTRTITRSPTRSPTRTIARSPIRSPTRTIARSPTRTVESSSNIFKSSQKYNASIVKLISSLIKNDAVHYIYREIRKKYSQSFLTEWMLTSPAASVDQKYEEIFFKPMIYSLGLYINAVEHHNVSCSRLPTITYAQQFTANQLIDYIFTYPVSNITNKNELANLLAEVSNYVIPSQKPQFQSIQIAVNDGTTKPFAAAVLTELVQNSTDAIRYAVAEDIQVKERIDIQICDTDEYMEIIITDYIGIPYSSLLSLWIPFLSSKSTHDLMSTGEMGTGFFNVYRQPFTKYVLIITNDLIIKATPVISNLRVVDIVYEVQASKHPFTGTRIHIVLNSLSEQVLIRLNVDINLYVHNMLAYTPYPIYLNGTIVHSKTTTIYESNIGSVKMMDIPSPSLISTNGIPMTDLVEYVTGIFGKQMAQELYMDIIIDIKKDYYMPVQSRSRLAVSTDKYISSVFQNFIGMALYQALLYKINNNNNLLSKYMPNIYSNANLNQFFGWSGSDIIGFGNIYLTNIPYIKTVGIFNFKKIKFDGVQYNEHDTYVLYVSLTTMIQMLVRLYNYHNKKITHDQTERYINMMLDPSEITAKDILHKWIDHKINKKTQVPQSIVMPTSNEEAKLVVSIRGMEKILNRFINVYYDIGKSLPFRTLPTFSSDAPVLEFMILDPTVNGHFDGNDNKIRFNVVAWKNSILPFMNSFNELVRLYKDNVTAAIQYFRLNSDIKNIIGNVYPANTLIHELQHSILKTDHSNIGSVDIHGINDLTYDGVIKPYGFDEGCRFVYGQILTHGFLDKFLSDWL